VVLLVVVLVGGWVDIVVDALWIGLFYAVISGSRCQRQSRGNI
jgi:hypothetical protein